MAEEKATRVIELVFRSLDDSSKVIKNIGQSTQDMAGGFANVTAPVANATLSLLKFEATLAATGVAVLALATKLAVDFQASSLDLQKVLGDTDASIEVLQQRAIDLSNEFGVSSQAVIASAAAFKQAGFSADEAFLLVRQSLIATKITELDAQAASEAFIKVLKGFGLTAQEIPAVLDQVNEVTNNYAVSAGTLTDALGRVSPIAKQMNLTTAQTIGILTPMVEVFQDSERASTAFNTVMLRLISDTKDVTGALSQLGVSQTKANGELKDGATILNEVQKAFAKLPDSQKPVIAQMLAGTEQAAKMSIVFDNLEKTTKVTATALEGIGHSVEKELKVRMQAAEVQLQRLTEGFKNAAIEAGLKFLPGVTDVAKALAEVGLAAQQLISNGNLDGFFAAVNVELEQLAAFLRDFATNLPKALKLVNFEPLREQLGLLAEAFGGLFGDVNLSSAEGLAKLLQTFVNIATNVIAANRGMAENLPALVSLIGTVFSALANLNPEWVKWGGAVAGAATILSAATGVFTIAGGALKGLATVIGGEAGLVRLLSQLTVPLGSLAGAGPGGVVALAAAAGTAGVAVGTWLNKMIDAKFGVGGLGGAIAEYVHGPSEALNKAANEAASRLVNMGKATSAASSDMAELYDPTFDLIAPVTNVGNASKVAWQEVRSLGDAAKFTSPAMRDVEGASVKAASAANELAQATKEAQVRLAGAAQEGLLFNNSIELAAHGFDVQAATLRDSNGELVKVEGLYTKTGKSIEDFSNKAQETLKLTAKEQAEVKNKAEELQLKWAELEQKDREVVFRARADIQIAEIEAATERVKAAFESINTTIESTGSLMGSLVEGLIDARSPFDKSRIEDLLTKEDARRQQALDLQKELVEAQTAYLQAATDRFNQGDSIITITGDGLEPELESFMFRVLERIQVKANSEGQAFLLGLPTVA